MQVLNWRTELIFIKRENYKGLAGVEADCGQNQLSVKKKSTKGQIQSATIRLETSKHDTRKLQDGGR